MKTTVKVSIGRLAFHVDSDAYQRLKNYLDRLEAHFANKESGKEIVSDIEERLSELLTARLSQPEQVVTLTMIEEVIAIMGMPDDMESDSSEGTSTPPPLPSSEPPHKRLYRDLDNQIIGGVCSGLATYFNVDAVLVRLLFVLGFFGSSFFFFSHHAMGGAAMFVYLVLWIAVPAAHTAKEKLEMRSNRNPTIAEIEKKLLEETGESQDSWFVRCLKVVTRIFIIFFGVVLLVVALSGFLVIPCLYLFDFVPNITVMNLFDYVHVGTYPLLFKLFLSLVLFLPFMGLVYIAVRALLGSKRRNRVGTAIFLLWVAALIGLAAVSFPALRSYNYWTKEYEQVLVAHSYDTLYVNVSDKYKEQYDQTIFNYSDKKVFPALWSADSAGRTFFYLLPNVEVVPAGDTGNMRITYIYRAAGKNRYIAQEKLERMRPKAFLRDSLLLLEPFIFDKKNKWSGELMEVRIHAPEGKVVKFKMLDGHYEQINVDLRDYFYRINIHIEIDDKSAE